MVAAASWSPATGPAKPCASTKPIGPPLSVRPLDAAGMLTSDVERMAAGVLSPDGLPRFVWTDDDKPDPTTYTLMLLRAVAERQRWQAQYNQAKAAAAGAVTTVRQLVLTRPIWRLPATRAHPITRQNQGRRNGSQG